MVSSLPERIGPYRVLERLGAGGMGEVFLAYDERLDRRVALKRILPEVGSTPERRERFRREARVAARLNHPAIVQVYDVVAEEDVDTIVMEYVEGKNLRRLAGEGGLTLEGIVAVARIAHDIALGLEEAHRQGVVHRDLKSENVLVTRSGQAKIADFGIAKRLLDKSEDSLTQGGHVLGTYRTMSPEQARGEPVDYRSDLFSLGVLLYEVLAGRSPFEADNDLATVNRIVHHRQAPLREIVPGLPGELSLLVDHLLQKDPLLRPRSAGEVARELAAWTGAGSAQTGERTVAEPALSRASSSSRGSLAPSSLPVDSALTANGSSRRRQVALVLVLLAAVAGGVSYFVWKPPREPLDVAVLRPEVRAPSGVPWEPDLLASGVRMALLRGLLALDGVSPRPLQDVDAAPGTPMAVARALSADEVVATTLECRRQGCRAFLSRVRGRDGRVVWAGELEVPVDDFYIAASAVESQIRGAYPDRTVRSGSPAVEATSADIKELLELRRRFDSRQASLDSLLAALQDLRRRAPRFLDVYLLEMDVARFRFFSSRDPKDLDRAFTLAGEARRLAPEDSRPLTGFFYAALEGGELQRAEEALAELERLAPGDVRVLELRSGLLLAQGRTQEAVELMRTEVERRPSSKRLVSLGQVEYQRGEIATARSHLEAALERSPGHADALALLARLELVNGDPRRAVELYEKLAQSSPAFNEHSNLGVAYFLIGRHGKAAETFERLVEQDPKNASYALNLADAYLLLGRRREADELYRRVLDLIARDSHATGPQFLTVKAQALAHLGEGLAAVAAVREALRLAPEDGPVAFEAAVVYAVLGESASALASAETALKHGWGVRWFNLPWFDPLRDRPEFRRMLAAS